MKARNILETANVTKVVKNLMYVIGTHHYLNRIFETPLRNIYSIKNKWIHHFMMIRKNDDYSFFKSINTRYIQVDTFSIKVIVKPKA